MLNWTLWGNWKKQLEKKKKKAVWISTTANPTVPTPLVFGSVAEHPGEHHPSIPKTKVFMLLEDTDVSSMYAEITVGVPTKERAYG